MSRVPGRLAGRPIRLTDAMYGTSRDCGGDRQAAPAATTFQRRSPWAHFLSADHVPVAIPPKSASPAIDLPAISPRNVMVSGVPL